MIYLKSIFKNLFIELQYHGIEDEAFNAEYLIKIANELKLPLIAANDAHMVDNSEESIEARRLVRFNYFKKSQTVDESDKELYLKTDDELRSSLLKIYNEEIVNKAMSNLNVLSYCKVEFPDEKHYPKVSSDVNFDNLLEKRRQEMISNGEWNDDYQKRLDHEVKIIKQMGYVDYHLVVRDFCIEGRKLGVIPKSERANMPEDFNEVEKWIKTKGYKEGVGIGPGRGSAAGSLVCYLLGITNIDPIKYDLLFERYLNPSRVSMPDIDTDVATSLRPFIIKYLKWKYGHRAVCSIATETTYAARAAVQMAGRERASQLYDHEPKSTATLHKSEYNRVHVYPLSDAVPDTPKIKLNDCIDDLKAKFGHDKEAMLVLNHALLLEGVVSGTGVHAGGVVISDNDNINEYLPLAWNEEKQVWTAQCDMVKVEERGLLKMDLLGLNTLDCINDCLYLIKKTKGISIDINKIPFEPEVFKKIYASGLTNSVFQFESQGMKSMLRDFKPTCFEDLILLVACYRPGPMQYLTDEGNSVNVIKVKNGQDPLRYLTPELEPILKSTYGGMIYQEQVMQVVQSLAGYSLGDADNIRRYMSKKKKDKLAHERQAFIYGDESRNIDGCVKRGISEDIANQLFDEMTDFASYAFNKSHAAAYAFVSYQTAWLKYHYPVEFECAMFNNKKQADFEPIIEDCKFLKIKLLQPDVNKSDAEFTTEGNCIRWGYYGIKGIGTANIDIIENIKTYGPYVSFKDFLVKNIVKNEKKTTILPKKITETFINAGAFDSLNSNRKDLYDFVEDNKLDITSSDNSEQLLKDIIESIPLETNPEDTQYNVENETELLGFVLSLDPLKGYRNEHKYQCIPISNVVPGQSDIMGYVTNIKDVCLKSGKAASVITIQGRDTSIEVWAYDNVMDKAKASLHNYKVFKFTIYKNEKGFITLRNFRSLNKGINEYNITIQTPEEYILFEDILKDSKYQQDYEISVSCKLRKTASGFQEHMSYGNVFVSGKALNILDSKIGLKKWSSKSV